MIRPLPAGANWTAALLDQNGVQPGAKIDVSPSNVPPNGVYPHLTEDLYIDSGGTALVGQGPGIGFGQGAPPTSPTLQDAYANHVRNNSIWKGAFKGTHVLAGTQCRSLWGIRVDRKDLRFVEEFDVLRGLLNDGTARYNLPVSSSALKTLWREGGVASIVRSLPRAGQLHVRVGLARPFDGGKCYMMINGVYW